jgi:Cu/Zn superoxide dismutase
VLCCLSPVSAQQNWTGVALVAGANAGSEAVYGSVTFTQIDGTGDVQIDVSITGLPVGMYGFHVHQFVSRTHTIACLAILHTNSLDASHRCRVRHCMHWRVCTLTHALSPLFHS